MDSQERGLTHLVKRECTTEIIASRSLIACSDDDGTLVIDCEILDVDSEGHSDCIGENDDVRRASRAS